MPYANLLGSWPDLVARLDAAGAPADWAADDDALATLESIAQLRAWTSRCAPEAADRVLGAVVRRAAVNGFDDDDAVVVLLHLLLPGATRIARRVEHLIPDALAFVLGELTIQIKRFPVGRRVRAFAANLLRDTHLALWRGELKPYRTDRLRPPDYLVDPIADRGLPGVERPYRVGLLDQHVAGPDSDDLDVVDLLRWARATGAVDPVDLAALIEVEFAEPPPGEFAQQYVARQLDTSVRTVQRRRKRALAALRECGRDYVGAA